MRIALLSLLLILSFPATAELGGPAIHAMAGRSSAKAVRHTAPSAAYSVQEVETEDGTTIREFMSASGEVFAVVWAGPNMPDLRQLFGSHFDAFRSEMQARGGRHGPVRVDRSDLVVESGGHPRAFRGRAYLPNRLPAGVSPGEIK